MSSALGLRIVIALPLLLSACGTDSFYIERATFSQLDAHRMLRTKVLQDTRSPERIEDFVLTGHRIATNDAMVLAYRTFSRGFIPFVDQSHFEKLTVLLPADFSKVVGGKIMFKGNSEAIAFWSQGSANFPGKSGCYGYGSDGSFTISSIREDSISGAIDLTIRSISPAGWEKECGTYVFKKALVFSKKSFQQLTPWDGGLGSHIYDESIRN